MQLAEVPEKTLLRKTLRRTYHKVLAPSDLLANQRINQCQAELSVYGKATERLSACMCHVCGKGTGRLSAWMCHVCGEGTGRLSARILSFAAFSHGYPVPLRSYP